MSEAMLATAGKSIKLWNPQNYSLYQEITSDSGRINGLTWNQDGQCLASLGETGNDIFLSAVNAKSTTNIGVVREIEAPTCIQFASRSPYYLGVGNSSGAVAIWNVKSQVQKKVFTLTDGALSRICFNHSDSHLTAATKKGSIFLLSVVNNSTAGPFKIFDNQKVTGLVYSRVKKSLLGCCSGGGSVALFDSHANKVVHAFQTAHSSPVASVSFSPVNELLMISVGYDKKFACYNVQTKQTLITHRSSAPLTSAAFLAGGQQVALGTMTGQVFVHDLRALRPPLATIMAHNTAVTNVLLQPSPRSRSESTVHNDIKKNTRANSAGATQSTTELKPSKLGPDQPTKGSKAELLSPNVFSPIRPTEHDAEINVAHAMDNQAGCDVPTPSGSLSIYDVLSPIRPVDQKQNISPLCNKLLSHDTDKDDVLSPIRYMQSNSGDRSSQDQSLTLPRMNLDDEAPVPFLLQNYKENVEPGITTGQCHDVEKEEITIDHKFTTPIKISQKTELLTPRIFSPLHKDTGPKIATPCEKNTEEHDQTSKTAKSSTNGTTEHFTIPRTVLHTPTEPPKKKVLMEPLQATNLMPQDLGEESTRKLNFSPSTERLSDLVNSDGVPQLQVELIRSCMAEVLEEFQDDLNRRMMHLQYLMTKKFIEQDETMKQLHRQYSLNEDILLENERLRQEISHLRAKY